MKNIFALNQLRILKKTKSRFISIFVIVFLGASFFSGLRHTPSIMEYSMSSYLQDYSIHDINLISTLAFSEEDIEVISENENILYIEKGNVFDALIINDASLAISVYTYESFDTTVNELELNEGSFASNDDECVMDYQMKSNYGYELGDEITIENDQSIKTFTIVGFVSDTRYIAILERGSNSLGDGTNNGFIHILTEGNTELVYPHSLYDLREEEVLYNDIRIILKDSAEMNVFSDEYIEYVESVEYELTLVLSERFIDLYESIVDEASDEVSEYLKEYEEGELEYNENLLLFTTEIANAKLELLDAKQLLIDNQQLLLEAQEEMSDELNIQADQISDLRLEILALQESLNEMFDTSSLELEEDVEIPTVDIEGTLEDLENSELEIPEVNVDDLNIPSVDREDVQSSVENALSDAQDLEYQQYQDDMNKVLDDAISALDSLEIALASLLTLQEANIELEKAQIELELAETQLSLSEITTMQEFDEARLALDEAYELIVEAQEEIANIPKGDLYFLTKNENIGVLSFAANSDSIAALAYIFPMMFYLVAALVCLTSMTRMIEEQRLQNGTLRALGYEKKDVIMQYLIYSFFVTSIATILGILFGVYFFSWLIYFLYTSILYGVSAPIHFQFDVFICLQTLFISVIVTMGVSFAVSYNELKSTPASLLRPKAPKMGKRITMERIPFIWTRLSFNQKVTLRNLFRYKKRFLMLIIGIGGCTALMVTGFGLRNSIDDVVAKQYEEVWTADAIISFTENYSEDTSDVLEEELLGRSEITGVKSFYQQTIMVDGTSGNYQGTLIVPNEISGLDEMISLVNGSSNEEVLLDDDGVLINQKLSELLDVEVNDTITITIANKVYEVQISGIYDMYYGHYIIMSNTYYEEICGSDLIFNKAFVSISKLSDVTKESINSYINEYDDLTSITYMDGNAESFEQQISGVNSVVLILVLCAAALAFVVLYNLTNINIQERKSEIATIKVLGFYPKEVYDYIFRENILLSIIGSFVGCIFGTLLHAFVIRSVEIENSMFVRQLNIESYLYSIVLTIIFTLLINFVMRPSLNKIDMVESLKSVE